MLRSQRASTHQRTAPMEPGASSSAAALERPAAQLTVPDVYDIAALLGHEFERVIDRFGCEFLVGLVHKVVRVLELLEALVSRGGSGGGQDAEELRRELERLRQERSDRLRQEKKQQQELELMEDVWRGEVQDLLGQIGQLQAENRRLTSSLLVRDSSAKEDDSLKQEGMSEKEKQMMQKLKDLVEKQRDAIRAKDHELTLRNEDVEALQMQQHRLIKINQDLRHRMAVVEGQAKALIQQKVELEAAAQAQQQDIGTLQLEATRLRKEIQSLELERELAEIAETPLVTSGTSPQDSAPAAAPPTLSRQESSVWAEFTADHDFLASVFEQDEDLSLLPGLSSAGGLEKRSSDDEKSREIFWKRSPKDEAGEETDSPDEKPDKARFTLQELRDVLQEKNELKAQVFMLQEELAYYQSEEEFEDGLCSLVGAQSPPPSPSLSERTESGIRRLIFTAIMPMVAAGLIADDPTLLPIRRLLSSV